MKPAALLLAAAAFLFAACIYEAPLVAKNKLLIDSEIPGLWEAVPEQPEAQEQEERNRLLKFFDYPEEDSRMLILKFSDTEYAVDYGMIRYRA